jgi:hypothetical protein
MPAAMGTALSIAAAKMLPGIAPLTVAIMTLPPYHSSPH